MLAKKFIKYYLLIIMSISKLYAEEVISEKIYKNAPKIINSSPNGDEEISETIVTQLKGNSFNNDNIFFSAENTSLNFKENIITATENVNIFSGDLNIRSDNLIYNTKEELVLLYGNVEINSIKNHQLFAKQIILDNKYELNTIKDLRINLDDGSFITAKEANKKNKKYKIRKICFSSCKIKEGGTPTWSITANKGVYKEEEGSVNFTNSIIKVKDVPIFYFPYFSFSNLDLERKYGFLEPSIDSYSELGQSIRIPFYIPLGIHRSIIITTNVYQKNNPLFLLDYEGYIKNGKSYLNLSFTDPKNNNSFYYIFFNTKKNLNKNNRVEINIEKVNDSNFLKTYNLEPKDSKASFYNNFLNLDSFINLPLGTFYMQNKVTSFTKTSSSDISSNQNINIQEDFNEKFENNIFWQNNFDKFGIVDISINNYVTTNKLNSFNNRISKSSSKISYNKSLYSSLGEINFETFYTFTFYEDNQPANQQVFKDKDFSAVVTSLSWNYPLIQSLEKYLFILELKTQGFRSIVLNSSNNQSSFQGSDFKYISSNAIFDLQQYNSLDSITNQTAVKYGLNFNIINNYNYESGLFVGQIVNFIDNKINNQEELAFSNIFIDSYFKPNNIVYLSYTSILNTNLQALEQNLYYTLMFNKFEIGSRYYVYKNLSEELYGTKIISDLSVFSKIKLTKNTQLTLNTILDQSFKIKESYTSLSWGNDCIYLTLYAKQTKYEETNNSFGFRVKIKNVDNFEYNA